MSEYDAVAPSFDRHRALPQSVPAAIRAAILESIGAAAPPRLLDFGAGTGRIGDAFVAAGDDYVGVDLSRGMLCEFARRGGSRHHRACLLVQADGCLLPFCDAAFDAVLMIHAFGGMRAWRDVITEARRVLRSTGSLVIGQTMAPPDGIDARMKQRLAEFLTEAGVRPDTVHALDDVQCYLKANAQGIKHLSLEAWSVERTPAGFLERHRTGAHFSQLPEPVKNKALRKLSRWAVETFGSLDAVFTERHRFELRFFRFTEADP